MICLGALLLASVASMWLLRTIEGDPGVTTGERAASQGTPLAGVGLTLAASPTPDMPAGRTATPGIEPTATLPAPTQTAASNVPTTTAAPAEVPTDNDLLATLRERATTAEVGLRSGLFEATMTIGDDDRSAAIVRFEFADATHESSLHITTTYGRGRTAPTTDHLVVGSQAWQRRAGEDWVPSDSHPGAWTPVQAYLPHLSAVTSKVTLASASVPSLTWYDASLDADVTLFVDPRTATPLRMRRVARAAAVVLDVEYRGWNVPIRITVPE